MLCHLSWFSDSLPSCLCRLFAFCLPIRQLDSSYSHTKKCNSTTSTIRYSTQQDLSPFGMTGLLLPLQKNALKTIAIMLHIPFYQETSTGYLLDGENGAVLPAIISSCFIGCRKHYSICQAVLKALIYLKCISAIHTKFFILDLDF